MHRPPPRRAEARTSPKLKFAIPAAIIAIAAAVWVLRPSPYSKVKNLESGGSSIIAFGDSLTAGYGATREEAYPSRLSSMIGATVINAGVSGDTTDSALARLDESVLSQNPRVVIIGLGGNDYLRGVSIADTEANLRTITRRIHDSGAMVILLGFRFPSLNMNYEAMYERVADETGSLFIPDLLDGIMGNNALKSDAIHPNARGYQLMAERISGPTGKLIAKANSSR